MRRERNQRIKGRDECGAESRAPSAPPSHPRSVLLLREGSNKHVESRAIERKLIRSSWSAFKNSLFFARLFLSRVLCARYDEISIDEERVVRWFSRSSGERFVKSILGLVISTRYTLALWKGILYLPGVSFCSADKYDEDVTVIVKINDSNSLLIVIIMKA